VATQLVACQVVHGSIEVVCWGTLPIAILDLKHAEWLDRQDLLYTHSI
jgi:hypothetical protein